MSQEQLEVGHRQLDASQPAGSRQKEQGGHGHDDTYRRKRHLPHRLKTPLDAARTHQRLAEGKTDTTAALNNEG